MFKSALVGGVITVNNPAIWRPILAIEDAASAYIRSIEANSEISGVFNVPLAIIQWGKLLILLRTASKNILASVVKLEIKHVEDFRITRLALRKPVKY